MALPLRGQDLMLCGAGRSRHMSRHRRGTFHFTGASLDVFVAIKELRESLLTASATFSPPRHKFGT